MSWNPTLKLLLQQPLTELRKVLKGHGVVDRRLNRGGWIVVPTTQGDEQLHPTFYKFMINFVVYEKWYD